MADKTLPHDDDGFLKGERVPWMKSMDTFREIRDDLSAIRSIMEKGVMRAPRQAQSVQRASLGPVEKPAAGPQILPDANRRKTQVAEPRRARKTTRTDAVRPAATSQRAQERESNGRFVGRGKSAHGPGDEGGGSRDESTSRLAAAASDLGAAVRAVETPDIDPAVAVGKEVAGLATSVRDVVQPAARGFGKIFGKDGDPKERRRTLWFRRIFSELRGMRGQDKAQHIKQMRLLGEIEKKPTGWGNGEGGGGIAGFLGSLLGGVLGPILGAAGTLLKFGGGLLKRIPLVGGLVAGGGLLSGVMGGDSRQIGSGAGMLGGMFAGAKGGAALGTLLFPGLGTVVGGAVGAAAGAFFGEKAGAILGDWLGKVNWSAIGDKVVGVFEKAGELLGKQWEFTKKVVTAPARAIRWAAGKTNEFVKDKTGVDLGEKAREVGAAVGEKASAVGSAAMGKLSYAFGGKAGARKALLAQEMQAAGITDPKAQANFMANVDHESGGFKRMEESFRYSPRRLREVFGGRIKSDEEAAALVAGGPQAIAEKVYGNRADLGNTQAGDGYRYRGRGLIQLTGRANYAAAGKALGLDLENDPDLLANDDGVAAKVATWYWKNRVGNVGGDVRLGRRRVNGGLNGIDDVTEKFGNYHAAAASGELASMASKAGGILRQIPAVPVQTVQAPPPAQAPAMPIPTRQQKIVVEAGKPKSDVGQDVKDRRIAHVATGGMSGGV